MDILHCILVCNVSNDVVKQLSGCTSIPLPVHIFIQVAGQLLLMTPPHPFNLNFYSVLLCFVCAHL